MHVERNAKAPFLLKNEYKKLTLKVEVKFFFKSQLAINVERILRPLPTA